MKAVIMAGGEGSRLRPLTCACPKPMVPVLDRPVMAYTLDLLRRHGVAQAAVTLMYLASQVTSYFGDGTEYGVHLTYFTEPTPLGTAGSVGQAAHMLDETTVVLSGDGLTNCDLTAALRFHRERGALATLVLKKVQSPLEYGVVLTDGQGRVQRFVEKPGWGEVCSDAVNTGIYLLEPQAIAMIPSDRPWDFGRDMFPRMVEDGLPVYGWLMEGYWCDIGDSAAYLRAHVDLLDGRMGPLPGIRPGVVNRAPGAIIDKSAVLEAPCYVGPGARVEAEARIGPYAVLGAGSQVGQEASVKRTVLMRGAQVEARCQLRGAVLQCSARAGQGSSAFEESVLGEGSLLGEGSTLMPGVKIWPHKVVGDGEKVGQNVVWGGQTQRMVDGAFFVSGPAQLVRQAQAYAEAMGFREVVLARDESAVGLALHRAALAALMAQGVQVIDVGCASVAQTRYALGICGAQGALHVARDRVLPLGRAGTLLNREQQRRLLGLMAREDYPAPFSGVTRPPQLMSGTDRGYIQNIIGQARASFSAGISVKAALYCQHEQLLSLAERAFRRAGCPVRAEWEEELMELAPGEIGLWLSDSGESVGFSGQRGITAEPDSTLLLCWAALEMGIRTLVLPRGATRCAGQLARRYGAQVVWTASGDAAWQQGILRHAPQTFSLFFDGIQAALAVTARLADKDLSLDQALEQLPHIARRTQVVPVQLKDKGRLLKQLAQAFPGCDLSDGLTLERDRGWAWISPGGDRQQCLVMAESPDAEFARELCDFCYAQVEKALKDRPE